MIIQYIAGIMISFLVTGLIIPYFIRNAAKWSLLDKPGGRKIHVKVTPVVGGLSIWIGAFAGALIGGIFQNPSLCWSFLAFTLLMIVGLVDDRNGMSAGVKWLAQACCALILMANGYYIKSFYHILGLPELHYGVLIAFSLIFITGLINAVNLMDGMDGLVGGLAAINFLVFGIMFFLRGDSGDAVLAFTLTAALVAFLLFNFAPAKIFMGDAGALLLGGVWAYFFIRIWNQPRNMEELYVAIGLVSLPVFDMLRVFIYRLINRRHPFSADRSHFHHYLSKTRIHHAVAALIMYILNLLLILQAILLSHFRLEVFIVANLVFFLLLFFLVREHAVVKAERKGQEVKAEAATEKEGVVTTQLWPEQEYAMAVKKTKSA